MKKFCAHNIIQKQTIKGATLLELLLYVGIVTTILFISGSLSMNILFGKAKATALEELGSNARIIMQHIMIGLNEADGIVSPAFQGTSDHLIVSIPDSAYNPTIISVQEGVVQRSEGVSLEESLSSSKVIVTDLRFYDLSYEGSLRTVRVALTLESKAVLLGHDQKIIKTFYTTIHKDALP